MSLSVSPPDGVMSHEIVVFLHQCHASAKEIMIASSSCFNPASLPGMMAISSESVSQELRS